MNIDKYPLTRNVNLCSGNIESKREEIKRYFLNTYGLFEKVFDILASDDVFSERPEKRRHQLIFYFGHTAAFYINKLVLGGYLTKRLNTQFESIFAIGVDEMAWDDLNHNNYNWPSVDAVRQYRKDVKVVVTNFIDTVDFTLPIGWDSPMWIIMMGCEHERIHIETSSVLHRQLDICHVRQSNFFQECTVNSIAPINELVNVKACRVILGKSKSDCYYGWDNEYGTFQANVASFEASKYLVSNGEFLEFVCDGGYQKDIFWSEEGKRWKNYEKITHPAFWIEQNGEYLYRTLTRIIPMPLSFPVDVNYLEAEAFCAWKSMQTGLRITLPSEAMWHALCQYSGVLSESSWGEIAPANINLEHYASSCPVDMFAHGDFYDVIGNVWQWTTTPIDGFDGFDVHPIYDDFSTPTFDGKHAIIKGGSWISTGNEVLWESRYAFRRHFYQHAGFRYVAVDKDYATTFDYIEKDFEVIQDIQNQYQKNELFYATLMMHIYKYIGAKKITKALDLGCGVGRIAFELAKKCHRVFGIDFSARFIKVADHLKKEGYIQYPDVQISTKEIGLDGVDATRLEFWQGDACNLKPVFKDFDFVIGHAVVDVLYDQKKFYAYFGERVAQGAIAIFSSTLDINIALDGFTKIDEFGVENYQFIVLQKI